jgi:sugar lactone lactonase YvrE
VRTWSAQPATDEVFVLAEGPLWDARRDRLLWVDIQQGLVLEGLLDGDRILVTGRHEFTEPVGAVTVDDGGRLLVAAGERLVVLDLDGARTEIARVVPAGQARRLNDGKTDPAGRYLVGTRAFGPSSTEVLARLRPDGDLEIIDDDLTLANGLAWSPDGSLLYSIDTLVGHVWVRDYDPRTGAAGERRPFVGLTDGYPDGMCVDADGQVWVAVWGRGEIRRFDASGTLIGRVAVDAPHTSSVAFAGPNLDLLVITTATDELDDAQRAAFPDSGRLFTADVGVAGAPVPTWNPRA